jgi:hypothetical protein
MNLLNLLPESAVSLPTQLANLPMACYNDHSLHLAIMQKHGRGIIQNIRH